MRWAAAVNVRASAIARKALSCRISIAAPVSGVVIVEIKSFSFHYTQTPATIHKKFQGGPMRGPRQPRKRPGSPNEGQAPASQVTVEAARPPRRAGARARRGRRGDEDARRRRRARGARAGGWGPVAGDEGSGSWIARRALQAVARATDGRGRKTSLVEAACTFFNVSKAEDLSTAVYAPNVTNKRIADFGRHVVEAAKRRDAVARGIVAEAGRELACAAVAVIRKLRMERERFQVAYVGGVFAAGELMLGSLREEVARVAPRSFIAPPVLAPAEAAARMASEPLQPALAGC